jgi:non-ribosomal peptide synthetase component E (peptide arylation enzyme)
MAVFCRLKALRGSLIPEVPKIIEFVDELPFTSVGKIDKKVLRK